MKLSKIQLLLLFICLPVLWWCDRGKVVLPFCATCPVACCGTAPVKDEGNIVMVNLTILAWSPGGIYGT